MRSLERQLLTRSSPEHVRNTNVAMRLEAERLGMCATKSCPLGHQPTGWPLRTRDYHAIRSICPVGADGE